MHGRATQFCFTVHATANRVTLYVGGIVGAMEPPLCIGIDVGGTFTDLLAQGGDGDIAVQKVPSTPANPEVGVLNALRSFFETTRATPAAVESLFHGSTVTTNALIERDGAETGLLITDGFDAVPIVGTQARPPTETINPFYQRNPFLIPPRRTVEIPGRIEHDGNVLNDLDETAVREAARELKSAGVTSIAVSYLFSFVAPEHEERTRELILDEYPDCHVSLSTEVSPRIREYPRLSTTAIDAYVTPSLDTYLQQLTAELDDMGIPAEKRFFMLSHGGLVPFETAVRNGCRTLLSGPAAGVNAGQFVGHELGFDNLVTIDMGGTSADVAVIDEGEIPETIESNPDGFPLSVPTVEIGAIGAGGGTIADVTDGRLQVGPESAGADPGPVCYGRGGTRPTVTDANVVLGRLSSESLLGGEIDVAADQAEAAVRERVGAPLGLSTVDAAAAILELVTDKMRSEIQLRLSRRGHDPREFALFAYGGAGPTHAPRLAHSLGIPLVIVPRRPGVNSAFGLLTTDIQGRYARSHIQPLSELSAVEIEQQFRDLTGEAIDARTDEGFAPAEIDTDHWIDLRYEGQGYELSIQVDLTDGVDKEALRERFHQTHEARYGHRGDEPLEAVTFRVASTVPVEPPAMAPAQDTIRLSSEPPAPKTTRQVYDPLDETFHETPIYHREGLAGSIVTGPAIVEQLDTTILIESQQLARFDEFGNAIIEVEPDE